MIDFLNLVFGKGEIVKPSKDDISKIFWDDVLIPFASKKYNYPVNGFKEVSINMNALYYSFLYHAGIGPLPNESEILKSLSKWIHEPFPQDMLLTFKGKAKSYQMKNLPINIISAKSKEYWQ